MSDPKGFLKHPREGAERRPVEERVGDWREFYRPTDEALLKRQAGRCMDCGVPFCQGPHGCPVENLIPDWNDLVHQGRWREALRSLHATNNFPEFTGRLCPAPCESACVLGISADPVSIRLLEWKIIDHGFDEGWVEPEPARRKTGERVAVVGSGPAGLAAAQQLARLGHEVTVYEKASRPGGLLRYGIPDFKMEKSVLDRRLAQLEAEGVAFLTGVALGTDLSLADLRAKHGAVCLAIGAEKPRDLPIPGRALGGIHFAMDYLIQQNLRGAGGDAPTVAEISAQDKHVVIIGGGDTGSDCLGTAHRQGARSVRQIEILPRPPTGRDPSTPWPQWPLQLRTSHAHEEGGALDWGVSTAEFLGEGGRVRALRASRGSIVDGRFASDPSGVALEWGADLVLLAMGFTGPTQTGESLGLVAGRGGTFSVDRSMMTSLPGVFAAGDASRGASLIVWASAEGRRMAAGVDRYLKSRIRSD